MVGRDGLLDAISYSCEALGKFSVVWVVGEAKLHCKYMREVGPLSDEREGPDGANRLNAVKSRGVPASGVVPPWLSDELFKPQVFDAILREEVTIGFINSRPSFAVVEES
jgi:hypothetical protein